MEMILPEHESFYEDPTKRTLLAHYKHYRRQAKSRLYSGSIEQEPVQLTTLLGFTRHMMQELDINPEAIDDEPPALHTNQIK